MRSCHYLKSLRTLSYNSCLNFIIDIKDFQTTRTYNIVGLTENCNSESALGADDGLLTIHKRNSQNVRGRFIDSNDNSNRLYLYLQ